MGYTNVYELFPSFTSGNQDQVIFIDDDPLSDKEKSKVITIFSLVTFYYSLNGPNWFVQTNWLQSNTDICDWYGINCETEEKQYPMEIETMTTFNTEKKVRTSTSKS